MSSTPPAAGGFATFSSCFPGLCEGKPAALLPMSLSQPCLPVPSVGLTRILPHLYLGSQKDVLNKVCAQLGLQGVGGSLRSSSWACLGEGGRGRLMKGVDEHRLGAQEDRRGPPQDQKGGEGGEEPGRAWRRSSSLLPHRWSPHATLLMSLGPWPALKESRVLKMVMRKEGKATAQAAVKFLGAYGRLWAGPAEASIPPIPTGLRVLAWEWAGLWTQLPLQLPRLWESVSHLGSVSGFADPAQPHPPATCPAIPPSRI